jgi:hypothetical protein
MMTASSTIRTRTLQGLRQGQRQRQWHYHAGTNIIAAVLVLSLVMCSMIMTIMTTTTPIPLTTAAAHDEQQQQQQTSYYRGRAVSGRQQQTHTDDRNGDRTQHDHDRVLSIFCDSDECPVGSQLTNPKCRHCFTLQDLEINVDPVPFVPWIGDCLPERILEKEADNATSSRWQLNVEYAMQLSNDSASNASTTSSDAAAAIKKYVTMSVLAEYLDGTECISVLSSPSFQSAAAVTSEERTNGQDEEAAAADGGAQAGVGVIELISRNNNNANGGTRRHLRSPGVFSHADVLANNINVDFRVGANATDTEVTKVAEEVKAPAFRDFLIGASLKGGENDNVSTVDCAADNDGDNNNPYCVDASDNTVYSLDNLLGGNDTDLVLRDIFPLMEKIIQDRMADGSLLRSHRDISKLTFVNATMTRMDVIIPGPPIWFPIVFAVGALLTGVIIALLIVKRQRRRTPLLGTAHLPMSDHNDDLSGDLASGISSADDDGDKTPSDSEVIIVPEYDRGEDVESDLEPADDFFLLSDLTDTAAVSTSFGMDEAANSPSTVPLQHNGNDDDDDDAMLALKEEESSQQQQGLDDDSGEEQPSLSPSPADAQEEEAAAAALSTPPASPGVAGLAVGAVVATGAGAGVIAATAAAMDASKNKEDESKSNALVGNGDNDHDQEAITTTTPFDVIDAQQENALMQSEDVDVNANANANANKSADADAGVIAAAALQQEQQQQKEQRKQQQQDAEEAAWMKRDGVNYANGLLNNVDFIFGKSLKDQNVDGSNSSDDDDDDDDPIRLVNSIFAPSPLDGSHSNSNDDRYIDDDDHSDGPIMLTPIMRAWSPSSSTSHTSLVEQFQLATATTGSNGNQSLVTGDDTDILLFDDMNNMDMDMSMNDFNSIGSFDLANAPSPVKGRRENGADVLELEVEVTPPAPLAPPVLSFEEDAEGAMYNTVSSTVLTPTGTKIGEDGDYAPAAEEQYFLDFFARTPAKGSHLVVPSSSGNIMQGEGEDEAGNQNASTTVKVVQAKYTTTTPGDVNENEETPTQTATTTTPKKDSTEIEIAAEQNDNSGGEGEGARQGDGAMLSHAQVTAHAQAHEVNTSETSDATVPVESLTSAAVAVDHPDPRPHPSSTAIIQQQDSDEESSNLFDSFFEEETDKADVILENSRLEPLSTSNNSNSSNTNTSTRTTKANVANSENDGNNDVHLLNAAPPPPASQTSPSLILQVQQSSSNEMSVESDDTPIVNDILAEFQRETATEADGEGEVK